MKKIDAGLELLLARLLARLETLISAKGGGVIIKRANGGYSLFTQRTGAPIARFRPNGKGDKVEVLWWRREKWRLLEILPLDAALDYIFNDDIFWMQD